MTNTIPPPPPPPGPALSCGSCSHPMNGGICPECGGSPAEPDRSARKANAIVLLAILLATDWGLDIAIQLASWILPSMLAVENYMWVMTISGLASIVGSLLFAITAILVLVGPWTLKPVIKALLCAALGLTVLSMAGEAQIMMTQIIDPMAGSAWMMLIPLMNWGGVVLLIASIGSCSHHDPGGAERWLLHRGWIAMAGLFAITLTLRIMIQLLVRNDSNPNMSLIGAISSLLGLVALAIFALKFAFLGLMIPWRRMLVRCSGHRGSITT
ncbi:MAG: hypothetical protein GY895_15975 [Phycisphaera sp.]|nr:hypothetical protein [Phycisphaera sp.]